MYPPSEIELKAKALFDAWLDENERDGIKRFGTIQARREAFIHMFPIFLVTEFVKRIETLEKETSTDKETMQKSLIDEFADVVRDWDY